MGKSMLDVTSARTRNRSNSSLGSKGRSRSRSDPSSANRVIRSRSNSHRSEADNVESAKDVNAIFQNGATAQNGQAGPAHLFAGTLQENSQHRNTVSGGHLTVNRQPSPTLSQPHQHAALHIAAANGGEPMKHTRSHENSGFLSTILNAMNTPAAHSNEASSAKTASNGGEKKTSFITRLDSLIKNSFGEDGPEATRENGAASIAGSAESSKLSPKTSEQATASALSASNIHFHPIRDAPINSLGSGDLSLDDFRDSRKDPVRESASSNPMDTEPLEKAPVNDSKSKRKSVVDRSDDEADDSADYDYSQIKFANAKRNKEFHQTFKKVPRQERLIDDFSCALSKDILIQGKLYLSEHYICFKSNILGWVTNLLIPLQEVVQIEKKATAGLFPNGMIIQTLYQNYSFASFISRDTVFNLMTSVWHHVLLENKDKGRPVPHGNAREQLGDSDADTSSQEEVKDDSNSDSTDDQSSDENDDESTNSANVADLGEDSDSAEAEGSAKDAEKGDNNGKPTAAHAENDLIPADKQFKGIPVIGPSSHEPTDMGYTKDSNETLIVDETLNAPMGVIFNILFGKDNSYYVKILEAQKNFDIAEDGITELSNEKKSRNYKYIKPLNNPVGPKQTTCLIEDKILEMDFEKSIMVQQTTQTPDVPSGNSFKTHTKIVLSWGENNSTRLYVVTMIAWSGKSWIKGLIEKGNTDGQMESMKTLIEQINQMLSSSSKGTDLKKKRSRKKSVSKKTKETENEPAASTPQEKPFGEKLNDLIEAIGKSLPVQLPISDLITGYLVLLVGFCMFIIVYNWMFHGHTDYKVTFGYSGRSDIPMAQYKNNQYIMFPTIETNFNDENLRLQGKVTIWDWVQEKSGNRIKVGGRNSNAYGLQEIEEIMRLTKLRLAELSKQIAAD